MGVLNDSNLVVDTNSFANFGTFSGSLTTDPGGFSNLVDGMLTGGRYLAVPKSFKPTEPEGIFLNVGSDISALSAEVVLNSDASIYTYDSASGAYKDFQTTLHTIDQDGSLTLYAGDYTFGALNVDGALTLAGASSELTSAGITVGETGHLSGAGIIHSSVVNHGTITATSSPVYYDGLTIDGPVTGGGKILVPFTSNRTSPTILELGGGSDNDIFLQDPRAMVILNDPQNYSGTLHPYMLVGEGATVGNIVLKNVQMSDISGMSYMGSATGGTLTIHEASGIINLHLDGAFSSDSFELVRWNDSATGVKIIIRNIVCFVTGTYIRTTGGDVAVERLAVGDRVVTASGQVRPIKWIGHRVLTGLADTDKAEYWPIRIHAGAFGPARPDRDLYLSPGHALCVDMMGEVFIPAGCLVNGGTIAPEPVENVTYWHVELDEHDVLLANNLQSESYLDTGNRDWFSHEATGPIADHGPQGAAPPGISRPFVNQGPIVDAARDRLAAHARALGWVDTSDMDMHLIVDGIRQECDVDGRMARFLFPTSAREVRLMSHCFVPAHGRFGGDDRSLGISVTGMTLFDGLTAERQIPLDHPTFRGQHPLESDGDRQWRWTNGRLDLDPALWDGLKSHVMMQLHIAPSDGTRWVAPARETAAAMVETPQARVIAFRR